MLYRIGGQFMDGHGESLRGLPRHGDVWARYVEVFSLVTALGLQLQAQNLPP